MKKILAVIALTLAAPALAEQAMLPSHAVSNLALQATADNFKMVMDAVAWQVTTTTQAGVLTGSVGTAVILTATDGTEDAPTLNTQGLYLKGLKAISVFLKTASAATAGGTLQAYLMNSEDGAWYRAADLDLTATATTLQTWPAIYVPVGAGRVYYNPVGIGAVVTTITIVGEPLK